MEDSSALEKLYAIEYGEAQKREIPKEYKDLTLEWLQPQKDDRVLELGIGSGDLQDFLKLYSDHVFGADINKDFLIAHPKQKVVVMNARRLGIRDGSIDKSVSLHTLEHIPRVEEVMQELDRVTRAGGLSLHVFPHSHIHRAEGALTEAVRMTDHPLRNPIDVLKLANKLHPIELSPKKLKKMLEGTNWRMERSQNVHVPIEKGNSWAVLLRK